MQFILKLFDVFSSCSLLEIKIYILFDSSKNCKSPMVQPCGTSEVIEEVSECQMLILEW